MQQPNIDLKNSTPIKCEDCQSETFTEVFKIRKISRLLSGAPNDQIVPIPTFQCSVCNHINKEFNPQFNDK